MPASATLTQFNRQSYLNLESFRKTGEGVKTPVWFVEDGGNLYFTTEEQSFKVKRIRRNPQVRIVPSDARGTPKGEWMEATAEIITDPAEEARLRALFKRKYGLMVWIFDRMSRARPKRVMVRLSLPG